MKRKILSLFLVFFMAVADVFFVPTQLVYADSNDWAWWNKGDTQNGAPRESDGLVGWVGNFINDNPGGIDDGQGFYNYLGEWVSYAANFVPRYLFGSKKYYTSPSNMPANSVNSNSDNSMYNVNSYISGDTSYSSILSTTNNTNYINIDNRQYEINNVTYNETHNVYNVTTVTNHNYYITYSPTYVNITYLDSANGKVTSNSYFYELPDGRNSWDLTKDEVFGMYFIYDAVNYDLVEEDDKTLGLFHFDGNFNDVSSKKLSLTYGTSNASYNYIEHVGFNSALYLDERGFSLNSSVNPDTAEFMLYVTQPGTFSKIVPSVYIFSAHLRTDANVFVSGQNFCEQFLFYAPSSFVDVTYVSGKVPAPGLSSSIVMDLTECVGYVIAFDGKSFLPVYAKYRAVVNFPVVNPVSYHGTDYGGVQYSHYRVYADSFEVSTNDVWIGIGSSPYTSKLNVGSWHYISISDGKVYIDGMYSASSVGSGSSSFVLTKPAFWNNYWMIDEMRFSSSCLYDGNYFPQSHPFDTNKVMVLPSSGNQGDIAVKSNVEVSTFRVGGVRPTYPQNGAVFVDVEKKGEQRIIQSVQQYQTGGWVTVDGSIYDDGKWVSVKNYDLSTYTINEDDFPNDPDNPVSSGGDDDSGSDDDSGGFFGLIEKIFDSIFGFLFNILGMLVDGIVSIIESITGLFDELIEFVGGFGSFLGSAFSFLPPEIISIIVVGLSLSIILMIIKFIRG